jgi:transglutaminase-like putative cysteine protease
MDRLMDWLMRVEHRSGYHYEGEVVASYNEARMTPMTTDRQVTMDSRLQVNPSVRPFRYIDYWATVVDAFDVHEPHTELSVVATSVVETTAAPIRPDASWAEVRSEAVGDRHGEFLIPTAYVPTDPELAEIAAGLADGRSPAEAVEAGAEWVGGHLTYTPGVTEVSTSAIEAFRVGHGVCQDYAHVTLALLRAMGVPGRYASGYLHPKKHARLGDTVTGESHAWVEAWVGDWWGFDPTNGVPAGERHVLVARGRDYADVPPLKGVYSAREGEGATPEPVKVEVRTTRLA